MLSVDQVGCRCCYNKLYKVCKGRDCGYETAMIVRKPLAIILVETKGRRWMRQLTNARRI